MDDGGLRPGAATLSGRIARPLAKQPAGWRSAWSDRGWILWFLGLGSWGRVKGSFRAERKRSQPTAPPAGSRSAFLPLLPRRSDLVTTPVADRPEVDACPVRPVSTQPRSSPAAPQSGNPRFRRESRRETQPETRGETKAGAARLTLVLVLVLLAAALALLGLGMSDPHALRSIADRLSDDGSATSLRTERLLATRRRLLVAGAVLLGAGLFELWRRRRKHHAWPRPWYLARLRRFWQEEPWHAALLACLCVLNLTLALLLVHKPITCDEAYTALFFAGRSPLYILSNYISPNNHVLHSLAAHASTALFGDSLTALRLPAMLAGLGAVPLGYIATRVHFGRRAGLIAAALFATWPYLLDVETNARGYSLLNLCVLGCIALVPRLRQADATWSWTLFAGLAAIGLATVPVMLFPFSMLVLWLAWTAHDLPTEERSPFRKHLGHAVLRACVWSAIVYLPSLLLHGSEIALTRDFVRPRLVGSDMLFWKRLAAEIRWTWRTWSFGALPWLLLPLAAAAGVGWWRSRRGGDPREGSTARRLSILAPLVTLAITLCMWKVPPGRCVTFLLVVAFLLIAAGLARWIDSSTSAEPAARRATSWLLLLLVAANVAGTVRHRHEHWRMPWYVGFHDAEEAAHLLRDELRPGDRIAGIREERPPVHYYYHRLTGEVLQAFYPFDPKEREAIRLNYDMRADDRPEDVRRVLLFDSGQADLSRLQGVLERSGFVPSEEAYPLRHGRIHVYRPQSERRVADTAG